MNTLIGVLIDRDLSEIEVKRAEHTAAVLRKVNDGPLIKPLLDPTKHEQRLIREHDIRHLMSRKRQLQAEINDVNDRINLLEKQP